MNRPDKRLTRRTLRISPAAVEYLEHCAGKRLGSSGPDQIRELVGLLLDGKLKKRAIEKHYAQSGHPFVAYNVPRLSVDFWLTKKQLFSLPLTTNADAMTSLEGLVRAHGAPEYRIEHHVCDKWCEAPEGTRPNCPGQILKRQALEKRVELIMKRGRRLEKSEIFQAMRKSAPGAAELDQKMKRQFRRM